MQVEFGAYVWAAVLSAIASRFLTKVCLSVSGTQKSHNNIKPDWFISSSSYGQINYKYLHFNCLNKTKGIKRDAKRWLHILPPFVSFRGSFPHMWDLSNFNIPSICNDLRIKEASDDFSDLRSCNISTLVFLSCLRGTFKSSLNISHWNSLLLPSESLYCVSNTTLPNNECSLAPKLHTSQTECSFCVVPMS